jgi:hypothetical protein
MFGSRFGSRSRRSAGRANKERLEQAFGPSSRGRGEGGGRMRRGRVLSTGLVGVLGVLGVVAVAAVVMLAGWLALLLRQLLGRREAAVSYTTPPGHRPIGTLPRGD